MPSPDEDESGIGAPPVAGSAPNQLVERDAYELLGHRAAVGASSREALLAVRSVLRGFGPVGPATGLHLPRYDLVPVAEGWQVQVDEATVHTGDDLEIALAALEWSVVTAALEPRDDLFHLHGAGLCLPTRRAGIVLAGDSGNGKTTLTIGLMLRGFTPFSDDVSLIEPATLDLRPLRRAFHVSEPTWLVIEPLAGAPLRRDADTPPGFFVPPQFAEQPVPVRWLLFPEYRPQQTPELIALSPSEAAGAILTQTTSLRRTPRLALAAAARLTEQARCYRFIVGDLAASVAMVQQLAAQ